MTRTIHATPTQRKMIMKICTEEGQYFTTAEPIDGGPEFELCIDYRYQPREQPTTTYPGCFESVTIDLVCARKTNNAPWYEFRAYTFLDYQMWMSEILELIAREGE